MGAWGHGPFENDDAGDWIGELEESGDYSVVHAALDGIVSAGEDYIEAPECSVAVAAAEVVAAALGRPVESLPDEVRAWVAGHPAVPAELISLARRAVAAIKSDSELRELWEESDGFDAWTGSMSDLEARLAG